MAGRSKAALKKSAHWEVVTSSRPIRYSYGTAPRPFVNPPPCYAALPGAPMVTKSMPEESGWAWAHAVASKRAANRVTVFTVVFLVRSRYLCWD